MIVGINYLHALKLLESLGFSTWETGGGCTALGFQHANGRHMLVTDVGGCSADWAPNEPALVGIYNDQNESLYMEECSPVELMAVARHFTTTGEAPQ